MKKYLILIISIVLFFACEDKKENDLSLDCAGVEGFCLADRNPLSSTWNQLIGPEIYLGKVTLYYFPSSET